MRMAPNVDSEPPLIQIDELCKSYVEGERRRMIIDHLTLSIRRGEFVALLGRSGTGKSTLLNLLSGIDQPDGGDVRIEKHAISTLSERERTLFRRRHIGFVFQFFNLIPTLTVEENLLLSVELNAMRGTSQEHRALELLQDVGLMDRRHSFPEKLSGGEQQRLALVRALAHAPLLLLADEPTGNLDSDTGEQVLQLLLKLPRESGTTVLVATHSQEIAHRADRILSLSAGRIREHSG